MSSQLNIVFVYNKSNPYGIAVDVKLLESVFRKTTALVHTADILEPPIPCDLCIHFEIPSSTWMPWAKYNILMVNPEWYVPAWNSLKQHMDEVWTKMPLTSTMKDLSGATFVPWTSTLDPSVFTKYPSSTKVSDGCLWLLGGSKNKRTAAEAILPLWQESWPQVTVYTTTPLQVSDLKPNVTVKVQELDEKARRQLQAFYPIHVAFSASEGFGLAAVEGEAAGAHLLLNDIAAYESAFSSSSHIATTVSFIKTPKKSDEKYTSAEFADFSDTLPIQSQLDLIFKDLASQTINRTHQLKNFKERTSKFNEIMTTKVKKLLQTLRERQEPVRQLPPPLAIQDCPPISVVTLTYNRRKFLDLAFHNLVLSDYPKEKIEWILVDDSDDVEEQGSDKVAQFAKRAPVSQVVYVPLPKKLPIGAKRNIGIDRASNEIIVFMDDDDHYPETSLRRRVGWLLNHPWKPKVVACSTIACYDLVKGVSAVNTPPFELAPAQRISEATLAFYKSFWMEQKFPLTNLSEGEGFLEGRSSELLDIPPQQIIVAFSHNKNASGRRIPDQENGKGKVGCFWGFPKEFLIWIHKLAGVEVEEET